jgi:type II secretory pathway pseudopilin PulG
MKKGFTLAELLAIIAIIALLAILIVPNVLKTYGKNKSSLSDIQKNQIISATEIYISDYCINPISDDATCGFNTTMDSDGNIKVIGGSITIGLLIENGYFGAGEISSNCESNSVISINSDGEIDISNVTCNFNK